LSIERSAKRRAVRTDVKCAACGKQQWARRRPFYVVGEGPPQVVVGRYADEHRVFSETENFKSEMPRGPGWEQFNKIMFAQFVTQMDGEQHARVAAC